ncbi:MAG: hypothetical protein ACKO96_41340 [Flammeovirgaceae bacterium]
MKEVVHTRDNNRIIGIEILIKIGNKNALGNVDLAAVSLTQEKEQLGIEMKRSTISRKTIEKINLGPLSQ